MCSCKQPKKVQPVMTQNYVEDTLTIMNELDGRVKGTPEQITRLFSLHNHWYPKTPEYGKHCSPCVQRVYNRMLTIKAQILNNEL